MDRLEILIVSAQFPYPPRSGFTTRVYQLARQLSKRHRVTLLSYAALSDHERATELALELRVHAVPHDYGPMRARRLAQGASMVSPRPFASRVVYSREMQQAIDALCSERDYDVVQLESSALCTFAFPARSRLVLDEHNIEYELLRRMSEGERSVARRAFNRLEYARFRRFERSWWPRVDCCVVTSEREAPVVQACAPRTLVAVVPNGVDVDYFRPLPNDVEPRTLVFNGFLTYRPNLDAAQYLLDEIWPLVLRRCPDARLTIVGGGPDQDLRRLRRPSVEVTGHVPDIRPYLGRAAVVGVPVRIGGGTRLKVVEGLALGKAMVSTSLGCEGLAVRDGQHLLLGDDAGSFAARVLELFANPAQGARLGTAGRRMVEEHYSWQTAGDRLEAAYERLAAPAAMAPMAVEPRRRARTC